MFGDTMNDIYGGIAEWLHENGVKTSYDVAYEKSRRDAGFPNFERKLPSFQVLGIYSADDHPICFCWTFGTRLFMNDVSRTFLTRDLDVYFYGVGEWRVFHHSFELADPGFLDILLSTIRSHHERNSGWCR